MREAFHAGPVAERWALQMSTYHRLDDDEGDSGAPFEFLGEPALCCGFGEAGDPLGAGSERDSVTAEGCLSS